MRSRSFLFFALGVAVCNAMDGDPSLIVAENGLISLNVPLTASRSGSRSTRTTHPHYVALFVSLLQKLGLPTTLELPYRFHTKGEMLDRCKNKRCLEATAKLTMSCSHPEVGRFRGMSPSTHCGYCVPCIIRRAAMEAAHVPDAPYTVDVAADPPSHTQDAGRDYRAFRMAIQRIGNMTEDGAVFKVLSAGPLPSNDVLQYAAVFLRGMKEVNDLIGRRRE